MSCHRLAIALLCREWVKQTSLMALAALGIENFAKNI